MMLLNVSPVHNGGSKRMGMIFQKDWGSLSVPSGLALGDHSSMMCTENDLSTIKKEMDADIVFITASDYVLYMYMYK